MTNEMREMVKVENYNLSTSNGSHIRVATKVIFWNGEEVKFLDKISKRQALGWARSIIRKKVKALIIPLEASIPGLMLRSTKDQLLAIGIAACAAGDKAVSDWANTCISISDL